MPSTPSAPDAPSVDPATHVVPESDRASRGSLMMAWWGVCSALFYIFLGATLATTYGSVNTIIAIVLTVVSYGLINMVLSRFALRTGLNVALFSRVLFGHVGAVLATFLFALTAMYYAIFEGSVIAVAASQVIDGLSYGTAAILVVLYSVPLVLGSVQRFLDKLNGVLLPFYLLGLVAAVIATGQKYGFSADWLTFTPAGGAPSSGWIDAYIAYMGVWVLMMFTFDFARFGRKGDEKFHTSVTFGVPFYLVTFALSGLVGIYLVTAGGVTSVSETGVVDQLIVVLGGGLAVIFIWVTQTRINSANFYLATVNVQAGMDKLKVRAPKAVWAVVVGVVVLAMMRATDVFAYLLDALNYQGIFVTAWVAIALVHILSPYHRRLFGDQAHVEIVHVPAVNPAGIGAWFLGAGVGLAMVLTDSGARWAPVVTVVLAGGAYLLALSNIRRSWFVTHDAPDHVTTTTTTTTQENR